MCLIDIGVGSKERIFLITAYDLAAALATGSPNEKTDPFPNWLVTSMRPLCASTMAFTIASPIPMPWILWRCPCPR